MHQSVWQFEEWSEWNSSFNSNEIFVRATALRVMQEPATQRFYITTPQVPQVYMAHMILTDTLATLTPIQHEEYMAFVYSRLYTDLAHAIAAQQEHIL